MGAVAMEVEKSETKLSLQEFEKVKNALNDSSKNGLISKLAEGLQHFIGYQTGSNSNGRITGSGIAPSNLATHRLCDATIAFTIGVLESLSKDRSIKNDMGNKQKVENVISELNRTFGKSVDDGLKVVAKTINTTLGRVTGRNEVEKAVQALGTAFQSKLSNATDATQTLAGQVGSYIDAVFQDINFGGKANQVTSDLNKLFEDFKTDDTVYDPKNLETKIRNVQYQLSTSGTRGFARDALYYGKENFMKQLEKGNYTSDYDPASKWQGTLDQKQNDAARIFLSCIPFVYYGLSYFCWRCRDKGEWAAQKINEGAVGVPNELRHLLYAMGYTESDRLTGHYGRTVMKSLSTCLKELSTSRTSAETYADYIKELRPDDPLGTNTSHPLSVLFFGSSCYFQSKRSKTPRPPSTIRTMLFWLTGLSVTPQFVDLLEHLSTLVKEDFKVAVSGLAGGTGLQSLSGDDLAGHLITSCLSSSWVLGTIQGRGPIVKPLLHEVFCSTEFSYPSSTLGAFNALANYAYALQFQLTFLLQQCGYDYADGCGWFYCRYGNKVQVSNVKSHLCPQEDGDCSTSSPLQAFLTDKLKGFSRGHPSDPSSHLAECSGYMCHVPMGFNPNDLRAASNVQVQGVHIA
ncbi:variant erythrocyte surface antigen-1 family protein [Babesia caballi]|uniref:Variant erythrocyte surface antigen-1 family protein n=1 Tax=Babesia caballi TaxID=5871 RepID=A0AAV4LT84_BABCB|nr:variant erythrocyte surface antigen-1 family protein [Babesia caballi]